MQRYVTVSDLKTVLHEITYFRLHAWLVLRLAREKPSELVGSSSVLRERNVRNKHRYFYFTFRMIKLHVTFSDGVLSLSRSGASVCSGNKNVQAYYHCARVYFSFVHHALKSLQLLISRGEWKFMMIQRNTSYIIQQISRRWWITIFFLSSDVNYRDRFGMSNYKTSFVVIIILPLLW